MTHRKLNTLVRRKLLLAWLTLDWTVGPRNNTQVKPSLHALIYSRMRQKRLPLDCAAADLQAAETILCFGFGCTGAVADKGGTREDYGDYFW